ncbi:noduline-like intrinsic protein [Sesbania bispinosa]|nr:noduline-like intrinsic protein [Sesbania bispinosa]
MSLEVQPLPQQQQPIQVYPTSVTYESPPGPPLYIVAQLLGSTLASGTLALMFDVTQLSEP